MTHPAAGPASKEIRLAPHELIITKTDPTGHITYANRVFMRIAGYAEHELLGKPHNLIRHPDMPRGAYRLMWKTLQQGHEFFAVVKNHSKNGDYYWVLANVTPDYDLRGQLQGYYSVRRPPSQEAIAAIEPVYAQMRQIEASHNKANAPDASVAWLQQVLADKGVSYQDFILSLNAQVLQAPGWPHEPVPTQAPFLRTQLGWCIIGFNLLVAFSLLDSYLFPEIVGRVVDALLLAASIALSLLLWRHSGRIFGLLNTLHEQLGYASSGELHHRATGTRNLGEVGKLAWQLNDFLDLIETYFKEINTCFKAISAGDYSRRPLSQGLPGILASSLGSVNRAIQTMADNDGYIRRNRLSSQLAALNNPHLRKDLASNQSDLKTSARPWPTWPPSPRTPPTARASAWKPPSTCPATWTPSLTASAAWTPPAPRWPRNGRA